jgi:hypothetical protein
LSRAETNIWGPKALKHEENQFQNAPRDWINTQQSFFFHNNAYCIVKSNYPTILDYNWPWYTNSLL